MFRIGQFLGVTFIFMMVVASGWTLNFEQVLESLESSYDVRLAELAVEAAERQVDILRFPGDATFSVQPGVAANTPQDGLFAESVDLEGSLALNIPLGLSVERRQTIEFALKNLELAKIRLSRVHDSVYLQLYSLYQDAWLTQEELKVFQAEQDAADATYEVKRQLYDNGQISFNELAQIEEDIKELQSDYSEAKLKNRIAWLEVASKTGMSFSVTQHLDPIDLHFSDLETPPTLVSGAKVNHSDVLLQREKIRQIEVQLLALRKFDLFTTVRANVNASSHNASLSFNVDTPAITGSYAFPIYTFGTVDETGSSSGGNDSSWSVGLSVNLSAGTAGESTREAAALQIENEQEFLKLESILEALEIQIRYKYQAYLLAQDAVEQAERSLLRDREALVFVEEQKDMGLVTENEQKEAQAFVERAEYQVIYAKINRDIVRMAVAEAAEYPFVNIMEGDK